MELKLAYGKTGLNIRLPEGVPVEVIEPKQAPGLSDPGRYVREALRRPLGCDSLGARARSSDRVGIVVNDITRPMPNEILLPALLEELAHVPDEQIRFFIATGTHRASTVAEVKAILGQEIAGKYEVIQNDAASGGDHIPVGRTGRGNEVRVLRPFVDCDLKILTGFIEPHFFAGFSGGPKAIVPGLAHLSTIMSNHNAAQIDHAQARWGITEGNPLWEELREAALMVPNLFLLNVALNREKALTRVFAGELNGAHKQGCDFVKSQAMVPVAQPFEVVIGSNSGYPLDLNLYQSVKGMSAASQVVKQGGAIIIAADCWDGIPDHGEYRQLLQSAESPADLLATIRQAGFHRQDMWQAQVQALVCQKAEVYFYSPNLSREQIESALLRYCGDLERKVLELIGKYGPKSRICILPEGPQTIPYLTDEAEQNAL